MQIGILHLSDMHLEDAESPAITAKFNMIAGTLAAAEPACSGYLVLVSGDVAYSGKPGEYIHAGKVLSGLKSDLLNLKSKPFVHVSVIPGNHDCNFAHDSDTRRMALDYLPNRIADLDLSGDVAEKCLAVQDDYFAFEADFLAEPRREKKDCFAWQRVFHFDAVSVVVNCVNTSWLSQQKEVQSHLLVPVDAVGKVISSLPTKHDLVITMLHHPFNWFPADMGRQLRGTIENGSDLILAGHEHSPNAFVKAQLSEESTQYYEGGVLYQRDGSLPSSFNGIIVDFETGRQRAYKFDWQTGLYHGEGYHEGWMPLQRNKALTRLQFENSLSFSLLLDDVGTGFTHSKKRDLKLKDLFVYPDMHRRAVLRKSDAQSGSGSANISADNIVDKLKGDRTVIILGADLAGKTTLAKALYVDFAKSDFVPLLISGKNIKSPSSEHVVAILRDAFAEQYSPSAWDTYSQLPPSQKLILVDDFDDCILNSGAQSRVLQLLTLQFDHVILFADEFFGLEEMFKEGDEPAIPTDAAVYTIREFGHLLRAKLITRWVVLGREHTITPTETTREVVPLEGLVRSILGKSLLPSHPLLVLTILQGWESAKNHDMATGSYGYLYELLIVKALSLLELSPTQIDVVMTYLSHVANEILLGEDERLSEADLRRIEGAYYDKYRMRLPPNIVARLLEVRVLANWNGGFKFQYPYYYYFFVARYFRDALGVSEAERVRVRGTLAEMAESIHYEDYANILSFFVYLTKDVETIRVLLDCSRRIYDEHRPCDLEEDVEFVNRLYTSKPTLILSSVDHAKNRDEYRSELDKDDQTDEQAQEPVEVISKGDRKKYDRSFSDIVKANVAAKMLQILGQVLRNSPGSLPSEVKQEVTIEAYSLGLRTLKAILMIPVDNFESIRTYFAELIKEHRAIRKLPALLQGELAAMADQGVIWLSERYTFGIVRRVSQAIGVEELEEIYADVLKGQPKSVPFRLIDLSIKLDLLQGAPEADIQKLDRELVKNHVAHNTLRELIFTYLYLAPVDYRLRQRLTKLMEITVRDSRLIDTTHKKRK